MANGDESTPAVWDPTARNGAGGWVRRPDQSTHHLRTPPPGDGSPSAPGPAPAPGADQPNQGPPPVGRPYLPTSFDTPAVTAGPKPAAAPHPSAADAPTTAFPAPPANPTGPANPSGAPGYGYPQQPPHPGPLPGYGYPPPPEYGYPPLAPPGAGATRRGSRTPLLVLLVVVLAAVLGGGLTWALLGDSGGSGTVAGGPATSAPPTTAPPPPSDSGSPQPSVSADTESDSGDAQQQAKALDDLLTRNGGARRQVGNAVAAVESCSDTATMQDAARVFDQAAQQREQLISDLGELDLQAVDGGGAAARLLSTAWQQSADADRAYGRWADTVISSGCPDGSAPRTSDREQADAISGQATRSKQSFVSKWNPIANRYGLASRTGDGI